MFRLNSYDIQSVRRAHDINETTHPEWVHLPRWGTYQYSDDLVAWLVSAWRSSSSAASRSFVAAPSGAAAGAQVAILDAGTNRFAALV
jgi:hypothetical protein